MPRSILILLLCAPCFAADIPADTARLARLLEPYRKFKIYEFSTAEFNPIQNEFLAWIDSRMRSGTSIAKMNAELKSANLLSDGPETIDDEFDRTYAGFLGKIGSFPLPGNADVRALKFGIYTGGYCNFDETIALYQRRDMRRTATINAETEYTHGFHLRELAIGRDAAGLGRVVATAWVASNCTSNWNGNIFRVDLLHAQSLTNVLHRGVSVFFANPVKINVNNDSVTFSYTTGTHDLDVLTRAGIASYQIKGGKAIRQAPIAPQFAGFIDEWLEMDDSEAARWSTPAAVAMHHALAAKFPKELLEWKHVAECLGPPSSREIAIEWSESKQTSVFLIAGSMAAEMRMLAVSDKPSPSCREIDVSRGLTSIFSEPRR